MKFYRNSYPYSVAPKTTQKVIAILTELGEKLPLKRPKSYDNGGYLLEDNRKKNRGYHIGVKYAIDLAVNDGNTNFKEKELALLYKAFLIKENLKTPFFLWYYLGYEFGIGS